MERSRSERQQRSKQRKRRNLRTLLGLAAAVAICGTGVWIWAQGSDTNGNAGSEQTLPLESPRRAETIASPHPSLEGGSPSPTPAASPSPSAAAAIASPSGEAAAVTAKPAASLPPSQPALTGPSLKMAFVGDVIFASTVESLLMKNGFDYPYRELKAELLNPDITVANLETPITTRGDEQKKQYTYRSKPEALKPFHDAGFDVVSLANNHIMDYGVDGLLDTLKYLDQAGIKRTGAGNNLTEAYKPAILERNGIKVAFLSFSHKIPDESWKAGARKPGTTQLYDPTLAISTITQTKQQADLVVVLAHWGEERQDKPLPINREMAKKFIDAGADLIVGTHPHVLQGFEAYKGKWTAYSLGNFIFTTNAVASTWESVILEAECSKSGDCRLSAIPVQNKYAQPSRMGPLEGDKLLERLSDISFGARVDQQGTISSTVP